MKFAAALGCALIGLFALGCHAKTTKKSSSDDSDRAPRNYDSDSSEDGNGSGDIDPLGIQPGDSAASRLIYLVGTNDHLYSFEPAKAGRSAYQEIGKLDCKNKGGRPQSMGVDRKGYAWVFYDSRELFKVSTADAHCEATNYKHPTTSGQLGMSFTSAAPGSPDEKLFIMSPTFGLATVEMPGLEVNKTNARITMAELTGGGDGRLFMFESLGANLSEISRTDFSAHPLHSFKVGQVSAWAFARFAGKFYLFTSPDAFTPSRTTVWDPVRNIERTRDPNIGFVVVGAGQSTLVPPTDKGGTVSEEWPPDPGATSNPNAM